MGRRATACFPCLRIFSASLPLSEAFYRAVSGAHLTVKGCTLLPEKILLI